MLLGKRPRPHIRRTTSMTAFSSNGEILDSNHHPDTQDHQHHQQTVISTNNYVTTNHGCVPVSNGDYHDDHGRFLASMVLSPRNIQQHQRSNSSGIQLPNFLTTCGLCSRRLPSGTDIYMYRGDTAFCSQECREKRMEQDERKEKYNQVVMATKKSYKTSSKSETAATT